MKKSNKSQLRMATLLLFVIELGIMISCIDNIEDSLTKQYPVIPKNMSLEETMTFITSCPEEMKTLSREEIATFPFWIQRKIIDNYEPNNLLLLWQEKFNDLLEKSTWNYEEQQHIKEFQTMLNLNLFQHDTIEMLKLEKFSRSWSKKSLQKFGWSKKTVKTILTTFFINESERESIRFRRNLIDSTWDNLQPSMSGSSDCNCSSMSDWCSSGSCTITNCSNWSTYGCGTLLMYGCYDRCSGGGGGGRGGVHFE